MLKNHPEREPILSLLEIDIWFQVFCNRLGGGGGPECFREARGREEVVALQPAKPTRVPGALRSRASSLPGTTRACWSVRKNPSGCRAKYNMSHFLRVAKSYIVGTHTYDRDVIFTNFPRGVILKKMAIPRVTISFCRSNVWCYWFFNSCVWGRS